MTGTRDEVIKQLMERYQPDDFMLLDIWSPIDVIENAHEEITEEQACDILMDLDSNFDASIGINWEIMDTYTNQYINDNG